MGVVIRRENTDGYHYIPGSIGGEDRGCSVTNAVILLFYIWFMEMMQMNKTKVN